MAVVRIIPQYVHSLNRSEFTEFLDSQIAEAHQQRRQDHEKKLVFLRQVHIGRNKVDQYEIADVVLHLLGVETTQTIKNRLQSADRFRVLVDSLKGDYDRMLPSFQESLKELVFWRDQEFDVVPLSLMNKVNRLNKDWALLGDLG